MTRRTLGLAAAPLIALLTLASAARPAEPFCGFFRPRGGESYSPLHYVSPAAYRVKYHFVGPDCPGCRISVYPPIRPVGTPVIATTVGDAPASPRQ